MLTSTQKELLFQLDTFFHQLEQLYTPQQMEQILMSRFTLRPHRDTSDHEQHLRSLEREKHFRATQKQHGL